MIAVAPAARWSARKRLSTRDRRRSGCVLRMTSPACAGPHGAHASSVARYEHSAQCTAMRAHPLAEPPPLLPPLLPPPPPNDLKNSPNFADIPPPLLAPPVDALEAPPDADDAPAVHATRPPEHALDSAPAQMRLPTHQQLRQRLPLLPPQPLPARGWQRGNATRAPLRVRDSWTHATRLPGLPPATAATDSCTHGTRACARTH